tara:strand:- start:2845 stop:3156 length:312 start_codon:yes stop_codon:yes gene_type:complete
MRWLVLLLSIMHTQACWFISKENTLEKITKILEPRTSVDRPYIEDMCKKMPAPFAWAVRQIGIEPALKDCDENKDGVITLEEMKSMDTCLTDCAKLTIIHMVL